tara:strand:+ start:1101 stop:1727 length:627 start_codon:yes stop_codon:yes gene_type:complete
MPDNETYKNLFIKSNDIVYFTPVASSLYEKEYIEELEMYYLDGRYRLKLEDEDVSARKRLAMWAYVYFVYHDNRDNDEWIEKELDSKKKMFRENIEDFKIIDFPYGQWDKETRVYSNRQKFDSACEYNRGLNKSIIKLRKYPDGQYTNYSISGLANEDNSQSVASDILDSKRDEIQNLQPLMEHYLEKNGGKKQEDTPPKDGESFELF